MHVIISDFSDSLIHNITLARLEKANYTVPADHRDGGLPGMYFGCGLGHGTRTVTNERSCTHGTMLCAP